MTSATVMAMIVALYGHLHQKPPASAAIFADAIAEVVTQYPPPPNTLRIESAAWLVVTGYEEGRFRIRSARGDRGKSVCAFQVMTRSKVRRRKLEASPLACVRAAYAAMRESVRVCPDAPLAQYAGGCRKPAARAVSQQRIERAIFDTL